jgi:hypothetical protein
LAFDVELLRETHSSGSTLAPSPVEGPILPHFPSCFFPLLLKTYSIFMFKKHAKVALYGDFLQAENFQNSKLWF